MKLPSLTALRGQDATALRQIFQAIQKVIVALTGRVGELENEVRHIDFDTYTGTTSSGGYLTVPHNLPGAPHTVVVSGVAPDTGPDIPVSLVADSFATSTFRVRALNQSGTTIQSKSIRIAYVAQRW